MEIANKPPRNSYHTWYTFAERKVENNTIVQVWIGRWVPRSLYKNFQWFRIDGTNLKKLEATPTAWMPLPPAPDSEHPWSKFDA